MGAPTPCSASPLTTPQTELISRKVSAPSPSSCLCWYQRPEPSGRTSTREEVGEVSREEAGQRVRFTELRSGLVGLLEIYRRTGSHREIVVSPDQFLAGCLCLVLLPQLAGLMELLPGRGHLPDDRLSVNSVEDRLAPDQSPLCIYKNVNISDPHLALGLV